MACVSACITQRVRSIQTSLVGGGGGGDSTISHTLNSIFTACDPLMWISRAHTPKKHSCLCLLSALDMFWVCLLGKFELVLYSGIFSVQAAITRETHVCVVSMLREGHDARAYRGMSTNMTQTHYKSLLLWQTHRNGMSRAVRCLCMLIVYPLRPI